MFTNIIWATDGSQQADHALEYALRAAERDNAPLHIVHVVERLIGGRAAGLYTMADEEEIKAKVRAQADELGVDHRADTTLHLIAGDLRHVPELIAELGVEIGADLIVVGSHGRGAVGTLVLGSVTQGLLHVAPCPVLVVGPNAVRKTGSSVAAADVIG